MIEFKLECLDKIARHILIASHFYYDRNQSMYSDTDFDAMCIYVSDNWEQLSPLRQFMLGECKEAIRSTAHHVKISEQVVMVAEMIAKENDLELCTYTFNPTIYAHNVRLSEITGG